MPELTIERIKELRAAIGGLPWASQSSPNTDICKIVVGVGRWRDVDHHLPENAVFIAAAPDIVDFLLAELEKKDAKV